MIVASLYNVLVVVIAAICSSLLHPAAAAIPPRYIFVFGDSYSTINFTQYSPEPTFDNPIGVHYPGNTTCGGPNWLGLLVQKNSPPNTIAYDFGATGATVNATVDAPGAPGNNFVDQVEKFQLSVGNPELENQAVSDWRESKNLFILWFGINDINLSSQKDITDSEANVVYNTVVQNYYFLMNSLYSAGARDFLLVTVPPFERSPLIQQAKGSNNITAIASRVPAFNTLMKNYIQPFMNFHPGSNITLFDSQPVFNYVLNDPQFYGAPDDICYDYSGYR